MGTREERNAIAVSAGVRSNWPTDFTNGPIAPADTGWLPLTEGYTVQIVGAATSGTFAVERSTRDPAGPGGPNTALVDTLTGNPAALDDTRIAPQAYFEDGCSWIRVRPTALNGAVKVDVSGKAWR